MLYKFFQVEIKQPESKEVIMISDNSMKIWCIVTLKQYENLVYCNLKIINAASPHSLTVQHVSTQ